MRLGVKPYACTICDRRFYGRFQLQRHSLTHTGTSTLILTFSFKTSCTSCWVFLAAVTQSDIHRAFQYFITISFLNAEFFFFPHVLYPYRISVHAQNPAGFLKFGINHGYLAVHRRHWLTFPSFTRLPSLFSVLSQHVVGLYDCSMF